MEVVFGGVLLTRQVVPMFSILSYNTVYPHTRTAVNVAKHDEGTQKGSHPYKERRGKKMKIQK